MTSRFDPSRELIVVPARLVGPASTIRINVALDTGASHTLIQPDTLRLAGYEPAASGRVMRIVTGSRVESAPIVVVDTLAALGRRRAQIPILAHRLPPELTLDGVLGLDFLRGGRLTIDFHRGTVDLE